MAETTEPISARAMFAQIALTAAKLPVPRSVSVYPEEGRRSVCIRLATVAEGQAWARRLGGSARTYVYSDGLRYLDAGFIVWHGWRVSLDATEPAAQPPATPEIDRADMRALRKIAVDAAVVAE